MKQDDWLVVGSASIFVLLGVVLLTFGVRNLWRAERSEFWPKTPAVVTVSGTNQFRSGETMYAADINFAYQVGGRSYTTQILHFGQTAGSADASEAQLIGLRFPPNTKVTVSYNPGDPSIAAAQPGFDSDALWLPGAGLAFAVPGVMFIVLWFAMSRGDNRGLAIGMGLFSTVFATLGIIFLANGLPNMWRAYQSPHWPQVKGIIVSGERDTSLNGPKVPEGDPQFTESSGLHFVYRFEVDGHTYYSNVRRFGQSADRSMQNSSNYPLGSQVTVTYAPGNPSISTIETGVANETYWIPTAGAALFLFGMAVFFVGIPMLTR